MPSPELLKIFEDLRNAEDCGATIDRDALQLLWREVDRMTKEGQTDSSWYHQAKGFCRGYLHILTGPPF